MDRREWSYTEQKQHREQWAQALESGEFRKGQGQLCQLHNGHKLYCVMGVLETLSGGKFHVGDNPNQFFSERSFSFYFVSLQACKWAGLQTTQGNYIDVKRQENRSLVYDNDADGMTFKKMAKIIRAEPRRLFISPEVITYDRRK